MKIINYDENAHKKLLHSHTIFIINYYTLALLIVIVFYLSDSNFCIEVDEVPYNLSELLLKKNTGKKYRRVY